MNAKSIFSTLWRLLSDLVWVVGAMTIVSFSMARWPTATLFVGIGMAAVFLGVFLWHYFVVPFREAYRGAGPRK